MTGKNLEIISQMSWYENSFRIDWEFLNLHPKLNIYIWKETLLHCDSIITWSSGPQGKNLL